MKKFIIFCLGFLSGIFIIGVGFILGYNSAPPYKDKIYLPNCTNKHYIVIGTRDNLKGISIYSNRNESVVMSPDEATTKKIIEIVDKTLEGIE
jgi:carbohydrate-binding DOMON domain-containing protein